MLEVLVRNEGKLVAQRQLLQEVWGPRYETETNYLRVYLAQLRRKLEPDPSQPRYLITEPGIGYRFVRTVPQANRPSGVIAGRSVPRSVGPHAKRPPAEGEGVCGKAPDCPLIRPPCSRL